MSARSRARNLKSLGAAAAAAVLACSTTSPTAPQSCNSCLAIDAANEVEALSKKAAEGDGAAALALWKHYEFHERDTPAAMKWLRVSARAGNSVGRYNLGIILAEQSCGSAFGTKEEGLEWLSRAAASGDPDAADYLRKEKAKRADTQGH